MLFALWSEQPFRATGDLDLLGLGTLGELRVQAMIEELAALEVEADGVTFETKQLRIEKMNVQDEYKGVRLSFLARMGNVRIPMKIDVGLGDVITPAPVDLNYPTLLDLPVPRVRAYPVETVIAEKFQAMVELGIRNSRMKDFFDLWAIALMVEVDGSALAAAIKATFAQRDTDPPRARPLALTEEFTDEPSKLAQWAAFTRRMTTTLTPTALRETATLQEYRDRSWLERTLLGQLRISVATAPGTGENTGARLAVGATVQLLSQQDPRLSETLLRCLETQADLRAHIVDQATREHVYPPLYVRIRAEIAASYPPLAAGATREQQQAREEAIDTIAEDQANRQLGAARTEFLYGDAEYQRYLGGLETCRSKWEEEKALAPSWLFSVGQAFQSDKENSHDFQAEGASVWTSYNRPFRLGTDNGQNDTRASALLYARYSEDQEVPIGSDTFAANVGVAALSLRRERDDHWSMALTVSHHTQSFADASQEDREFTQYALSASWKPEGQRFWVQGFYGGRGNEDEEVATLALVFDWGSSDEQ